MRTRRIYCFLFSLFLFLCLGTFAQPRQKFVDPREADEHFNHGNYVMAMPVYKALLKEYPKDPNYNYKIGQCILSMNSNKALAIPYLEIASQDDKFTHNVWFELGRAYHYAGRIQDAKTAYLKFKEKAGKADIAKVDHQLEMCDNAIELMKHPVNVTFENLGKEINSEYPDYFPFVNADESFLVFTSRRKGTGGATQEVDGYYSSDIFSTKVDKGKWAKAKSIGPPVSTGLDEQAVSLSSDGKSVLVYLDHIDSAGNIYISEYKKSFQKLEKLPMQVNSGFETGASISPDGNMIVFSSDREGGSGESDLYLLKKLPNGKWAQAQNLGKTINTKYEEDFPQFAPDGKTVYFASQGHSSMGDYDIFKTVYDEETNTWTSPRNLGFPLNTTDDNRCISFTADERIGYVSAWRENGLGDLDIYRIHFTDAEPRYCIVTGYVNTGDSINTEVKAKISVVNQKTKEEFKYTPIVKDGRYVMALTAGAYIITITSNGYTDVLDMLVILDMGSFTPEIHRDFKLQVNSTNTK